MTRPKVGDDALVTRHRPPFRVALEALVLLAEIEPPGRAVRAALPRVDLRLHDRGQSVAFDHSHVFEIVSPLILDVSESRGITIIELPNRSTLENVDALNSSLLSEGFETGERIISGVVREGHRRRL